MAINMAELRRPETAFLNPEVLTGDDADILASPLDVALAIASRTSDPAEALEEIHRTLGEIPALPAEVRNPQTTLGLNFSDQYSAALKPSDTNLHQESDDVSMRVGILKGCLVDCIKQDKSSGEGVRNFLHVDDPEELPAAPKPLSAQSGSDRIWRGSALKPQSTVAPRKVLDTDQDSPETMRNLNLSAFASNVVESSLTCESAEEALAYLVAVGRQAIYGIEPASTAWQKQNMTGKGSNSPLESLQAWHARLQSEAARDGVAFERHFEYASYRFMLDDIKMIRNLAFDLEGSGDLRGAVERCVEAQAYEVASRRSAGSVAAESAPADVQARNKNPTAAAKMPNSVLSSHEDRASMRELWDSRLWKCSSTEGIRERARIFLDMGKLALGSESTAKAVSKAAQERQWRGFVERGRAIMCLANDGNPNRRLRGVGNTEKGLELVFGFSAFIKKWAELVPVESEQIERRSV